MFADSGSCRAYHHGFHEQPGTGPQSGISFQRRGGPQRFHRQEGAQFDRIERRSLCASQLRFRG